MRPVEPLGETLQQPFHELAEIVHAVVLGEATVSHVFRTSVGTPFGHGLEAMSGLVQQRKSRDRTPNRSHHAGQDEMGQRQIVIGIGIGLFARRLGALVDLLDSFEGLAQVPGGDLLLDAVL